MNKPVDVLVVSAGNTSGWRTAASELAGALARAGATVEMVTAEPSPRIRTFALTDFVQARAARRAALRGLTANEPAVVIYCSITAALLWPRAGAIYLDSIAAENRPGRHGLWQRPMERRRLRQTTLVLAWSERALAALPGPRPPTILCPVPVDVPPGGPRNASRDVDAVVYAGDPIKRRLSHVLGAWSRARRDGETLTVVGTDDAGQAEGVEVAGLLSENEFRALLARARVFVAAPRREDYGIAALEALASGCQLVSTPAPGPYPALAIARQLDPRLVDEDLPRAIRTALDDPSPSYVERAETLLEPFSRGAVDRIVAQEVLPHLLSGFGAG